MGKEKTCKPIGPATLGRSGLADDFLLRATLQCLGGIISHELEEAVYFNTTKDNAGQILDGSKAYTLHFPLGQLPKVNGFWSLTLYDLTYNFSANPINRYDGGLTIYIQNTSPGTRKEANWLPAPQSGTFLLVMRTYMPGEDIIKQNWSPPGVTPA